MEKDMNIIYKGNIRKVILEEAKSTGKENIITRIDKSVYTDLERKIIDSIKTMVRNHPGGKRTLMP